MTGWNMPPGVNPEDIPGNSSEDQDWQSDVEMFLDWLARTGLTIHEAMRAVVERARAENWQLPDDTDERLADVAPLEWSGPEPAGEPPGHIFTASKIPTMCLHCGRHLTEHDDGQVGRR